MTVTIIIPAGEGNRYAPDAFDHQVGKAVTIQTDAGAVTGHVSAAEVFEGGQLVSIDLELPVIPWRSR